MLSPLATRVSMRNVEVVDDVCRSAFGCGGIDPLAIAAVAATTVLAFLVIATVFRTTAAADLIEEELRRLAAERDAFNSFRSRVADIEASEASTVVPVAGGISSGSASLPDDSLDRVREAYRGTVMAVGHYDRDYGEPLADNLAAEFGDDLALAVVSGTQLTPPLKAALLQSSREAAQRRDSLRSTLQAEAASIDAAAETLEDIEAERAEIEGRSVSERDFGDLAADWRRLGDLADRCRTFLADRQARVRELSASMAPGRPELHEYLYDDLEVRHPALADGAELAAEIDELRGRFLQALTRRV